MKYNQKICFFKVCKNYFRPKTTQVYFSLIWHCKYIESKEDACWKAGITCAWLWIVYKSRISFSLGFTRWNCLWHRYKWDYWNHVPYTARDMTIENSVSLPNFFLHKNDDKISLKKSRSFYFNFKDNLWLLKLPFVIFLYILEKKYILKEYILM